MSGIIDFRIKVGFFQHPKTNKLRRRLGLEGVISLLRLIEYCAINNNPGDLTGMDEEDIEIAAGWDGKQGALCEALAQVGFVDTGPNGELLSLHDFREHNPFISQSAERSRRAKAAANARWEKQRNASCKEHATGMQDACGPQCGSSDLAMPRSDPTDPIRSNQPNRSAPLSSIGDDDKLGPADVERIGYGKFGGSMTGTAMSAFTKRFKTIAGWEMKKLMESKGRTWKYAVILMDEWRKEAAKGPAPPAGKNPDGEYGYHPGSDEFGEGDTDV